MALTIRAPHPRDGRFSQLTLLLRQARERVIKRQADIARDAELDEGYVSKLFSGERVNPSRNVLIRLSVWGLGLSLGETDEILLAAETAPLLSPEFYN